MYATLKLYADLWSFEKYNNRLNVHVYYTFLNQVA
jgi:hypothetical protein